MDVKDEDEEDYVFWDGMQSHCKSQCCTEFCFAIIILKVTMIIK